MTTYQIVVEEPARQDMENSYSWGCEKWGIAQAQKWYEGVIAEIATLSTFPERHPIAPETHDEFQEEIRQMLFQRYRVLFTIRGDAVHVLHFRGAYRGK